MKRRATGRHAPPTTFSDVLRQSGPLARVNPHHGRFCPFPVSGWKIDPQSAWGTESKGARTSWSVLDSASGEWEEVDRFEPAGGHSQAWAYDKAHALAAKLNAVS